VTPLWDIVADKEVIICGGSGGVGKTTVSAALGAELARAGRRAVVVTIDPARRLADALGVTMEPGKVLQVNLQDCPGSLHAMMLTPELAVETFMRKLNADPHNPLVHDRFFQQGMAMLAASPEYLAVQELHDLHDSKQWDVIVLDTPPTRQSIDFLTAPGRLARALKDKSVVVELARPYLRINKMGFNLIKAGAKAILSIIDKFFGIETFIEFFTFFELAVTLLDLDRLEERLNTVNTLLQASTTTFLVVAAPSPVSIEEALYFHQKISDYHIAFGGFVINRVQAEPLCGALPETLDAPTLGGYDVLPTVFPKLLQNLRDVQHLRQLEQAEIGRLSAILREQECLVQVPRLALDVHDLAGIVLIGEALRG
jgi:anion-transporting  ArsA/GET3 family ATPase